MLIYDFQKRLNGFLVERVIAIQSLSLDMHKLASDQPLEVVGNRALLIG